jgi:hypothetical protein
LIAKEWKRRSCGKLQPPKEGDEPRFMVTFPWEIKNMKAKNIEDFQVLRDLIVKH